MYKLYLFKDQPDYSTELTTDNIINILGTKGSGKTTLTTDYLNNDNYIVINCDRLLELPSQEEEDKELTTIRILLKDKYNIPKIKEDFTKYYNDIIEYILDKKKTAIIEGNVLEDMDLSLLKGKIIIKRTAIIKSFIRAIKRDYKNAYFLNLERKEHKYFFKLTRLFKITKRRLSIFKQAKVIEKIMNELE